MAVSETIWVGTSIHSYSCVFLAKYTGICRCHCQSVLLGICARKRKAILATDTTRLPTVLYFLCSVSDHHSVAQYRYPTRYLAHPFGTLCQNGRALPKHPLFSGSISNFLLLKGLETGCHCRGSIDIIIPL